MTTEYLRRAFRYDAWANRRTLEAVTRASGVGERAKQVMAHLAGAARIWLTRLRAESTEGVAVWPTIGLDECDRALTDIEQGYARLLESLTDNDLAEEQVYRTTTGTLYRTARQDILTHLLLHGAYHRGQLAAEVKRAGGEPAATDFILFVREQ